MVFLIDATSSMGHLFGKLKVVLPEVFKDTYETLKKKKIEEKAGLEIQIVLYRNYNSGSQKILEYSAFESQPTQLINFIINSKVSGGHGNQAVEVGLQYVNTKLKNVNEIIVIGDAPGNTVLEIEERRRKSYDGE